MDADLVTETFDNDLGDTRLILALFDVITDLLVFDQVIGEIFIVGIPFGIPVLDYAYS